jgi:hypothetical protein
MKNNNRSSNHNSNLKSSYTNVSKYRQESGEVFEKEIRNRLLKSGIVTSKHRVSVSRGLTKYLTTFLMVRITSIGSNPLHVLPIKLV